MFPINGEVVQVNYAPQKESSPAVPIKGTRVSSCSHTKESCPAVHSQGTGSQTQTVPTRRTWSPAVPTKRRVILQFPQRTGHPCVLHKEDNLSSSPRQRRSFLAVLSQRRVSPIYPPPGKDAYQFRYFF
jgi:hypothetical protein